MQSRKTLAVGFIFVALAVYVYFFEWNKETGEAEEKLLNFAPEEAQTVALQGPVQQIRLQKDAAGRWKLTSPLQTRADESAVASLLAALGAARVTKTVVREPGPEELKTFGLDPPSTSVSVTLKSGVTLPGVLIGSRTPVGSSVYVRRDVKPDVLLTDARLQLALEKKVNDLREKRILEISESAVKELSLKSARNHWVLTKKGNEWLIDGPRSAPADPAAVQELLISLRNLTAQDFIDAKPAEFKNYGLDAPRLRLVINQNDQPLELLLGKPGDRKGVAFAASNASATVYAVPERALDDLDRDWQTLRDKHILSFVPAHAAKLQIQKGQESLTWTKDANGHWTSQPAPKISGPAQAIDALVISLAGLKAKSIVDERPKDLKRFWLDPPSLKVSIMGKGNEDLGTLLIGTRLQLDYYAQRAGHPTVYLIDGAVYDQIVKVHGDFADAEKTAAPGRN